MGMGMEAGTRKGGEGGPVHGGGGKNNGLGDYPLVGPPSAMAARTEGRRRAVGRGKQASRRGGEWGRDTSYPERERGTPREVERLDNTCQGEADLETDPR